MNKILQLSLASAVMATTAFSTQGPVVQELTAGAGIHTTLILPANQILTNAGTNNGLSNGTYTAGSSTAIDVFVDGSVVATADDRADQEPGSEGGTIGTNGTNDDNGLTVRHHTANWELNTGSADQPHYGINCQRGFISGAIAFSKEEYLQEMYDTAKLARIYSNYVGTGGQIGFHKTGEANNDGPYHDTILLSNTAQGTLGAGERALSNTLLFPNNSSDQPIIPGTTFIIPAQSSNATISANLSNSSNDFSGNFSSGSGYTPATNLQILPVNNSTLTFTGDNAQFNGQIIIGNNSTDGGTIAFGDSEVSDATAAGSTTMALGKYVSMSVNTNSTVSLAGGDAVEITKPWTFYDRAKLQATKRITLASGGSITFGASSGGD